MPRPKADFPAPEAIRALIRDGLLRVRVIPGARNESVAVEPGHLSVKVRARPTGGAANAAAEKLVARALGIATSRSRVVRGATSREKVLRVDC